MLPHSVAGILERIPIISRSIEHQVRRSCRPSILPDEAEQERPNQNQPREHGATEEADRVPSIGNWRNQAISQATPKRYTRLRNLRYGDLSPAMVGLYTVGLDGGLNAIVLKGKRSTSIHGSYERPRLSQRTHEPARPTKGK
jgi:hypothetical protein